MQNRSFRSVASGGLVVFLAMSSHGLTWAGDAGIRQIRQGAEQLLQTLEAMPFAAEGSGPAIYTFEFSECPHCQNLYRDWKGKLDGVQLRHMFYAVSPRSAAEMTALAKSRDVEDYIAYMEGSRAAPPHDDRRLPRAEYSRNVAAFNSIITPLDKVIEPVLRANGVITRNLVSPMLIWQENGNLYASGGYKKAHFARVLERVKAGNPAAATHEAVAGAASPDAKVPSETLTAANGPDVVGLRLGMTQAEAVAALRAHNPRLRLSEGPMEVTINDSNRRPLKVARYIKEIRALWDQGVPGYQYGQDLWKEQIVVVFAPPPADHRVQYIRRVVRYNPGKGPAFESVASAVTQKYGQATHAQRQGNSIMQLWMYDGVQLSGTQFLNWFNKSKISIDLSQPGAEGGTPIENSCHLGFYLVPHGHGLQMLGAILSESKATMNSRNDATRAMAETALQAHEAKLRERAESRQAPKL